MAQPRDDSDDESVEVSQKENAKEWFTPGELRQTNLRVLEWLRTEKNRPKTRQELLHQMRRFCFILTRVQWKALLAILADLQVILPVAERAYEMVDTRLTMRQSSKEVEWHLDTLRSADLPEQNELGAVFHTCKQLLLTMEERKEPLPTHGPDIRRLLEPLCDVRHELEPEEILHELVMTEFVEISEDGTVHYNEARLMHRETNWYAIAAMVVLLLSVSAALLEAMGRK